MDQLASAQRRYGAALAWIAAAALLVLLGG